MCSSRGTECSGIKESRKTSVSLAQVIQIRKKDLHVGCTPNLGDLWMNKALKMYNERL